MKPHKRSVVLNIAKRGANYKFYILDYTWNHCVTFHIVLNRPFYLAS